MSDITPDNLLKDGFFLAYDGTAIIDYAFMVAGQPGKITVTFWREAKNIDVSVGGCMLRHATTMQDIAALKRLFFGIQPEPDNAQRAGGVGV